MLFSFLGPSFPDCCRISAPCRQSHCNLASTSRLVHASRSGGGLGPSHWASQGGPRARSRGGHLISALSLSHSRAGTWQCPPVVGEVYGALSSRLSPDTAACSTYLAWGQHKTQRSANTSYHGAAPVAGTLGFGVQGAWQNSVYGTQVPVQSSVDILALCRGESGCQSLIQGRDQDRNPEPFHSLLARPPESMALPS